MLTGSNLAVGSFQVRAGDGASKCQAFVAVLWALLCQIMDAVVILRSNERHLLKVTKMYHLPTIHVMLQCHCCVMTGMVRV